MRSFMYGFNFYGGRAGYQGELPVVAEPKIGKVLALVNEHGGRSESALEHIDSLKSDYEVSILPTALDQDTNAANLLHELEGFSPDLLAVLGGDNTAHSAIGSLYAAAESDPKYLKTPVALLPFGSGNDAALSLSKSKDLRDLISKGRTIGYCPPQLTLAEPDRPTKTYYAATNIGLGATGWASMEFNRPDTHNHAYFKHPIGRHLLLGAASLKGMLEAKEFNIEQRAPDGSFGPEQSVYALVFFHALRFGIHARTSARFSDPHLREAYLSRKYSPKTALNIGCFMMGKAGVKLPTRKAEMPAELRVTAKTDQQIFGHIDDTEIPIASGSVLRIDQADEQMLLYTTRHKA